MKWLILLLMINVSHARTESAEAMSYTQKALLSYPLVKGYVKTAERTFFENLPISREYAGAFGSVAMTAISGSINTKQIKRMDVNLLGGKLRPDIVHNFKNKESLGLIIWNRSW